MAVEIPIFLLKKKLRSLAKGSQIIQPIEGAQLHQSIDKLSEVEEFLKSSSSNGSSNSKLLQAVYSAEDAIDTFIAIQKEKPTAYVHLKPPYSQSCFLKNLEKLVGEISNLSKTKPDSNLNGYSEKKTSTSNTEDRMEELPPYIQSCFSKNLEKLVGKISDMSKPKHDRNFNGYSEKKTSTEDRMEELPELIRNPDCSHFHISVVEYGSNRKPLQKIYHDESIKKHFECRAWVCVAEEFDKMKLLIDIFKQVRGKPEAVENLQLDSLQQDLRNFLVEKRYLVVLIDVRTQDIWEILKFALPNSLNGSRVIFSFREADAERFPDIRFFGREISLDSKPIMQVASVKSKDDEADILTVEQKVSWCLKGIIEYLKEETDIVGMRDTVSELAKLTLNGRDKYYLISVVDVEGSGRTTLVKTIYNSPYIRQDFECRAWFSVPASDGYDTRNMLIDIMKQITQESSVDEWSREKLEMELKIVLSKKRFLIVLDDVNLPAAWNDLQTIVPSKSNDSRVILITSDAFVATHCFSPSIFIFKLNRLQEDEGWKLFLKKARVSLEGESNPELMHLRKKIWQRCRGLPLATCVLGGLFSCKGNYTEWPKVIEQILPEEKKHEGVIEHTNQRDISMTDEYAAFDEGWNLGYKDLSPHLKACLDYVCLFPKSYSIPVRRLFYLWLAEGLETPREETEVSPEGQVKKKVPSQDQVKTEVPPQNQVTTEVPPEDQVKKDVPPGDQVKKEVPPQDQVKTEVPPQDQVKKDVPPEDHVKKYVPPEDQVKKEVLPEDLVRRDFDELERRNMMEVTTRKLDGSPKTCRLPSTLYDTLFPMAEGMGFFYVHDKSDSESSSPKSCIRRLVEHSDIHYNPLSDEFLNLHSFISFNTRKGAKSVEEVRNFLNKKIIKRGFGLLRVLDLERVYKPVLPQTMGKLKLLKYLGLRWTFLDSIPTSIGDLPCLETLDVKHTNITTLPMSIWKIKTLRHLYMNEIHFEMLKKKGFSLTNLHNLWCLFIGNANECNAFSALTNLHTLWGLFIGNAKDCRSKNWLKKLSSLRKLGLTFHMGSVKEISDWISRLTSLRSLKLRSIDDYSEPSDLILESMEHLVNLKELYLLGKLIRKSDTNQLPRKLEICTLKQLPCKLEILTLSMSQLFDDPMPILGQLKHLKVLRLFAHSYIGEKMTCGPDRFPQLHVLKLWVLPSLCRWNIEERAMPVLKELEIRYCRNLKKLEGLNNVTSLRELILTNMKEEFSAEVKKSLHKYAVTTENNWKVEPPWD